MQLTQFEKRGPEYYPVSQKLAYYILYYIKGSAFYLPLWASKSVAKKNEHVAKKTNTWQKKPMPGKKNSRVNNRADLVRN